MYVCGGDPNATASLDKYNRCSPCMWGVILLHALGSACHWRVPHVSGGDPFEDGTAYLAVACSLCMRGDHLEKLKK